MEVVCAPQCTWLPLPLPELLVWYWLYVMLERAAPLSVRIADDRDDSLLPDEAKKRALRALVPPVVVPRVTMGECITRVPDTPCIDINPQRLRLVTKKHAV